MPCPCMQCSPHIYTAHAVHPPTPVASQAIDPLFLIKYHEKMHKKWMKEQKAQEEAKKKDKPKKVFERTFSYLEMVGILMLFSIPVAATLKVLLRAAGL